MTLYSKQNYSSWVRGEDGGSSGSPPQLLRLPLNISRNLVFSSLVTADQRSVFDKVRSLRHHTHHLQINKNQTYWFFPVYRCLRVTPGLAELCHPPFPSLCWRPMIRSNDWCYSLPSLLNDASDCSWILPPTWTVAFISLINAQLHQPLPNLACATETSAGMWRSLTWSWTHLICVSVSLPTCLLLF